MSKKKNKDFSDIFDFEREKVIEIKNLDLYYGEYKALKNINMDIFKKQITVFLHKECSLKTL